MLGEKIKNYRLQKNLSLRELDKLSGYSHKYIQKIEKGKNMPSLFAIECIGKSLKLDQDEIDELKIQRLKEKPIHYPAKDIL